MSEDDLPAAIESNINATENDPGLRFQLLARASYNIWSFGPFGNPAGSPDMGIRYYKEFRMGFTDAEFQFACESIADTSPAKEFEYVFITREIDSPKYLL